MADAGISFRVQQMGAEGVRNRLREISAELRAGKPVTKDLKTEMRELGIQTGAQERVTKLSTRAFMDQHRTLQTTARVMSTVGSVARSVLAVTTAFSVAAGAFGKSNSQLAEAEAELARANRELVAALESGDSERIAIANENIAVFTAKVQELKDLDIQGTATNILNLGATIGIMTSSVISATPQIALAAPKIAAALRTIGLASGAALGPAALIAGAMAAVALAGGLIYDFVTGSSGVVDFFRTF